MFYSETLLAKTGPLARVWLAANLERKLTKQNVLSSNLENNVKDIIGTGQAPMALRLSGQLLLGVVKIYSRKARYLLDDCNDALSKIKMAFRPGNVDLPSNQTHAADRNTLILPDAVTEIDLFAPLPDPEDLLRDDFERRGPGNDPTLLNNGASLLSESQTPRREKRILELDDVDLGIDLGLEDGDEALRATPMSGEEPSIEIGRRATPVRDEPTVLDDDLLGIDYGFEGDTTVGPAADNNNNNNMLNFDDNDDFQLLPIDDDVAAANQAALARASERRQRGSASALSSLRSSRERSLERTFQLNEQEIDITEDTTTAQAAQQRIKRRKIMRQDNETQLHNSQIKRQQEDRSGITRAPTYLPRDPVLLQLMEMQRNGSFVSSIMGEGRMAGWAPELRGILSLEVVRRAGQEGERKRKRDSGVADLDESEEAEAEMPQLRVPPLDDEDDVAFGAGADDFAPLGPTFSDGIQPPPFPNNNEDEEDDLYPQAGFPQQQHPFDTTEAPLLHPSQSGPVSLGTKNAVHLLRAHFAPSHPRNATEPPTPSKRVKAEALFTDLCPERTTGRDVATKMFFELLVLGSKDAVKVEQQVLGGGGKGSAGEVGSAIRVRGKRGLWGDWAERGAGGQQVEEQVEEQVEV